MIRLRRFLSENRPFTPSNSLGDLCHALGTLSTVDALAVKFGDSLKWDYAARIRYIKDHFGGVDTSEEEEDKALQLILSSNSSITLRRLVNAVTWDELDDELDEADLTEILLRMRELIDFSEYSVGAILRWFFLLSDHQIGHVVTLSELSVMVRHAPATLQQELAQELAARRLEVVEDLAAMALRGQQTFTSQLLAVTHVLAIERGLFTDELQRLHWEVFYSELITNRLEAGEYALILRFLTDLVNSEFPLVRRKALFDMLIKWERLFAAMEDVVARIGSSRQQGDMRRFMDARRIFVNNFPAVEGGGAIAQALQAILSALSGAVGSFQSLIEAVQELVDGIRALNFGAMVNDPSDTIRVNAVNGLSQKGLLALLPSDMKSEFIATMLSSGTEDDEEDAILTILRQTKARSVAEFAQLAGTATWETLSSDFEGSQYDDLEKLFTF